MNIGIIWFIVETIIISIILIAIFIIKKIEKSKITSILDYIEKRATEKEVQKKIKECLDIIKQNNINMEK